jgi:hypothetical protein
VGSVYSAVRTDVLYKEDYVVSLKVQTTVGTVGIHVSVAIWPLCKSFPRVAYDEPACITGSPWGRERLTVSCAQSTVLVQHSALEEVQHRAIIRPLIMYTRYWGAPAREGTPRLPTERYSPHYLLTRFPLSLIHPPPPPPILKRFPSHAKKLLLLICVAVCSEASLLCIYSIYICEILQGEQKVSVHLMITIQKTRKNILNSFNHLPW